MIDTISGLADVIVTELQELSPKPTVFFGHSMGALLAFETAWRLEQLGTSANGLILSGRCGPTILRNESIHLRSDDALVAELKLLNGTDANLLDDEFLKIALPAIRNDYRAVETYTCPPERTVLAPITVFTGDNDPKTTVAEAHVWQQHTTGDFQIHVFPGGHFYLIKQQQEVSAELMSALDVIRSAKLTKN